MIFDLGAAFEKNRREVERMDPAYLRGRLEALGRFAPTRDRLSRDDARASERTEVRVSEDLPPGVVLVVGDRQTVAIVNGELVELEGER